ncbi:MAG: hypothetical protein V1913_06645 [Fibrobacterota bacterium]
MKKTIVWILCLCVLGAAQLDLNNDDSDRKKYGMSQAEWEKFREMKMSVDELERLIRCGITINEYSSRPWLSLGVSEQDWLAERCKGMADEDIQAFNEGERSDLSIIAAFLLPGSFHWRNKKFSKAIPLSVGFAIPLACYFAFPEEIEQPPKMGLDASGNAINIRETTYNKRPVFLVLCLADMIVSAIFAYRDNSDRHAPVPPDMQEPEPAPSPY